jgi:hypothetical protein
MNAIDAFKNLFKVVDEIEFQYRMRSDENGHCISGQSFHWELMAGSDARVLVPVSADSAVTVTLLRKIADWIKRDGLMTHERRKQLDAQMPEM